MMQEKFMLNGVEIEAPTDYKPVFATTSTSDSDRDQNLIMHNTPIATIAGYDMKWDILKWDEIATILNGMINKSEFTFHHPDPTIPGQWIDRTFYASNFNMAAQTMEYDYEAWTNLQINIRRIQPI